MLIATRKGCVPAIYLVDRLAVCIKDELFQRYRQILNMRSIRGHKTGFLYQGSCGRISCYSNLLLIDAKVPDLSHLLDIPQRGIRTLSADSKLHSWFQIRPRGRCSQSRQCLLRSYSPGKVGVDECVRLQFDATRIDI